MSILVLDSGAGGYDFISKMKGEIKQNNSVLFQKIFKNKLVSEYDKKYIKFNLMKLLIKVTKKNVKFLVIACHSASSCILDNFLKGTFCLNDICIYEPIIPTCKYITEKTYRKILILSTEITAKIGWHRRLLSNENVEIKYLTFPTLAKKIENSDSDLEKSIMRLSRKKNFLEDCDCVILGCTHYNTIKESITNDLRNNYKFTGDILDSNEILLNHVTKVENLD